MALHNDRKEYIKGTLDDRWLQADPLTQFAAWLEEYRATGADDATAFALSTVSETGLPDARTVLLKEFRQGQLIFFTNYDSKKGRDLAATPYGHALFFWPALERQIRIAGPVTRLTAEESDQYFTSRPIGSQWGAVASKQSQPIDSREAMEDAMAKIRSEFPNKVPRPEFWGGYAINSERIEFWQGRASRLHDRICYTKKADHRWCAQRLQP